MADVQAANIASTPSNADPRSSRIEWPSNLTLVVLYDFASSKDLVVSCIMRSFMKSARIQGNVIGSLVLREMQTRYGRENIGFLWLIGEPIIFCLGVSVMWTLIRPSHEHGIPVTAFVVTGYVPLTMWRHCVARAVKAFDSNGALMFHRQVTPLDIILARVILEVYGTIIAGLIVVVGAIILGFMEFPKNIGTMYLGLFYQILFCLACALIFASLTERSDILEKFVSAAMYLSIPFSGAFAMVDWIPASYRWLLLWSPPVHASEMIREGQFGIQVHAHYDLFYATYSCAILIIIGASLCLRVRKHIVVQ